MTTSPMTEIGTREEIVELLARVRADRDGSWHKAGAVKGMSGADWLWRAADDPRSDDRYRDYRDEYRADAEAALLRLTEQNAGLREESERLRNIPVDVVLHCPVCLERHVDQPQPEKGWTNPPHRTHECQHCGHLWRPYDVATNGIAMLPEQLASWNALKAEIASLREQVEKAKRVFWLQEAPAISDLAQALKADLREQWGLGDGVSSDDPAHNIDCHRLARAARAFIASLSPEETTQDKSDG